MIRNRFAAANDETGILPRVRVLSVVCVLALLPSLAGAQITIDKNGNARNGTANSSTLDTTPSRTRTVHRSGPA